MLYAILKKKRVIKNGGKLMSTDILGIAKLAGDIATGGLTTLVAESVSKTIEKSTAVSQKGDIDELEKEERIQEIENRISEYQARVAQELAIARRIENAAEVEIEEFYDTTGTGGVGLQATPGALNLGINGNGRKVTRRVYRFKGWNNTQTPVKPEEIAENVDK